MIIKSYIIEQNKSILNNYKSTLLYGQNRGIQNDLKDYILEKNKEAEIINLFQDDIIKNKKILENNIINSSLFNSKKIVLIQEVNDKIFLEINAIIELLNEDIELYLFSNNLEKKSKLRNFYEKEKTLAIAACYEDNDITLRNYIKNNLNGFNGLTPELINIIIYNSNSKREIIKNEIVKIKNYFTDKKLNIKDLSELLNIKLDDDFNKLRDASLLGQKNRVNKLLNEIEFLPENNFFYINQITYRVSKLLEAMYINDSSRNEELAIESLKPKVFWKDKPIYLDQLKKWSPKRLRSVLEAVGKTEYLMKTNTQIKNHILIKNLLVNICNQAEVNF